MTEGPAHAAATAAMSEALRYGAVIPTYNNPKTIGRVVANVRPFVDTVIVVDDGSAAPGRDAVETLGREGLAHVYRRVENGGKGAAVKDGLRIASELGLTHVLQIDADGQHDVADIPTMLAQSRAHPDAIVLGTPVFDDTAPLARVHGRKITTFWLTVICGRGKIADGLCGFRVYPVMSANAAHARGDRMDFDPEIAARVVLGGAKVINVPTRVRYPELAEGAVSHFRMVRDNWAIAKMIARLVVERIWRAIVPR